MNLFKSWFVQFKTLILNKKIESAFILASFSLGAGSSYFFLKNNNKNQSITQKSQLEIKKVVSSIDVERKDIENIFSTYSYMKGVKEVQVNPESKVSVKTIYFRPGMYVNKGDVIAVFDSESSKIKQKIADIDFQIKESEFQVNKVLAEKEYVSRNEIKQKTLEYEAEKAKRSLASIESNAFELKSPISGYISELKMREGDYIDDSSKYYVKVVDVTSKKVDSFVPYEISRKLKIGTTVKIGNETQSSLGVVKSISPIIDPNTGTVAVEVENKDKASPVVGSYVKLDYIIEQKKDAIALDKKSILFEKDKSFVYKVGINPDDGSSIAEKQEVKLGVQVGNLVEVTEGLDDGDTVVTEGQSDLKDQMPVEIFSL